MIRDKILVIDDEAGIRSSLKGILEDENYLVKTADTGEKGLNLLKGDNFGLIFLDILLPEMNGIEVLKRIKKIDANTFDTDARTYVDDLNDEFDLQLPEDEDYDTIGGFVFSHLGFIPKTGESFEYEGLKFTVTAAEARRIRRMRIKKTREPQS